MSRWWWATYVLAVLLLGLVVSIGLALLGWM